MILVFDSSIWISAIKYGGTPLAAILQANDPATSRIGAIAFLYKRHDLAKR